MRLSNVNPGSPEAIERGCRCPAEDNNHGKTAPWGGIGWWINEHCHLHAGPDPDPLNPPGPQGR